MALCDVDALKEQIQNWFELYGYYFPRPTRNSIPIEDLYDILESMPSAQPEPPWVPCKETLPDEGLECWITSKDGAVYQGMFTRRYGERRDSGFILNGFGFARLNTIVAWKPYIIPEPWEGGAK